MAGHVNPLSGAGRREAGCPNTQSAVGSWRPPAEISCGSSRSEASCGSPLSGTSCRSSPGEISRDSSLSEISRGSSRSEVSRGISPSGVSRGSSPSEIGRGSSPTGTSCGSSPNEAECGSPPSATTCEDLARKTLCNSPPSESDSDSPLGEKEKGGLVRNVNEGKGSLIETIGFVRANLVNLGDGRDLDAALENRFTLVKSGLLTPKLQVWEIDPFKLILKHVIGQGSHGTVYRGVCDGQDVAIKLLTDEHNIVARETFVNEIQLSHKLDHPNVTKFIGGSLGDSGLSPTGPGIDDILRVTRSACCVVTEYLAGGTMTEYLSSNQRDKLPFDVVVKLALDLARGLEYLHSQNIVHRDLKSENLLLDSGGNLKIADFGMSRLQIQDMGGRTGTPIYVAPEVMAGKPYGRKCDVYGFGICLWEIYCCERPHPDLSLRELAYGVVCEDLRPLIPKFCPRAFSRLMKKCWDPNPDKRPEMAQVVQGLQEIEAMQASRGRRMAPIF